MYILCQLIGTTNFLFSLHSDNFPIGAYSHYDLLDIEINQFVSLMGSANYNIITAEGISDSEIALFNNQGIDVIYNSSSIKSATKANYWEYEAEYHTNDFSNPSTYNPQFEFIDRYTGNDAWPEEMWYYSIQRDIDEDSINTNYKYGLESKYYSKCMDSLNEGFIIDTLTYHCKDKTLIDQISTSYISGYDYDYVIKFTMKVPQGAYTDLNSEICKVGLKLLRENIYGNLVHELIQFDGETADLITLTYQDFLDNEAVGNQFATFEFIISRNNLEGFHNTGKARANLCPVVWYCDNGIIEVDNVIITDTIYEVLDDPSSEVYQDLVTAVNNSNGHVNVVSFAGMDEPKMPQFRAHEKVKNIVESNSSKLQACVNLPGWEYADKANFPIHNATRAFSFLASPTQIITDIYPSNVYMKWGKTEQSDEWCTFQGRVSKMTEIYADTKNECLDNNIPFYPITQTFGEKADNLGDYNYKWSKYLLPPNETQAVLSFLPLCYGADGIYNFEFENMNSPEEPYRSESTQNFHPETDRESDTNYYHVGLVNDFGNCLQTTPQYYEVKAANEKISVIGHILKDLTWNESKTTTLLPAPSSFDLVTSFSSNVSISAYDQTGIIGDPESQHSNYDENYEGYVECSIYSGNTDYFMLVNRRANFPLNIFTRTNSYLNEDHIDFPEYDTNLAFAVADPQTVHFEFDGQIPNNYALVDQYLGTVYNDFTFVDNLSKIDIEIGPGEALLLEFRDIITFTEVTGTVTLADCFIANDISIRNSGVLNIGENVSIGAHVDIVLDSGAILNITGNNVIVGTSSNLTISGGATLNINGTIKFENNSKISNYGELIIGNISSATLSQKSSDWIGIISRSGSTTILQNGSTIENAKYGIRAENSEILVQDSFIKNCDTGIDICDHGAVSSLNFISSTIELSKPNSIGINIFNDYENNNILIGGTEESKSYIYGHNRNGIGVKAKTFEPSIASSFICENTNFSNLETGILNQPFRSTSHKILNCSFANTNKGVQVMGNGKMLEIADCIYNNNSTGIEINTAIITVRNNTFDSNVIGLDLQNTHSVNDFIIESNQFSYSNGINSIDVRISNSSPRITQSYFKGNKGISSVDNSKVDISYNANNFFMCETNNLEFIPSASFYSSSIIMAKGHNDFYSTNPYWDFSFSSNYSIGDFIDANYNWWNDDIVNTLGPAPTILADFKDSDPNVVFFPAPNNRYEEAEYEELEGNCQSALDMYKVIFSEFIESELNIWSNCVDKIFKLSATNDANLYDLIIYYEICYKSIPDYLSQEDKKGLQLLINNYIKKCYISDKQYQQAADIVVNQIEASISPVDSLFALMQLETIYSLSAVDSLNRSAKVSTRLNHLAPKSFSDYNDKQKDHWNDIYELLGIVTEDEENHEQDIPTTPTLYNNYPNPFNPETTISFSIPAESDIKISIYNIKGQKVKDLVNNSLEKGNHNVVWYSKDNLGKSVSSGVYFYQLEVNGKTQDVRKCLLLK